MSHDHDHENEITYFARTNFRNQMTKFGIKTDDRRRHVYIIGKTGMGKSTLMENMFLSDIYAGHGCCYVDPHGDAAEKLIDFIPSWRINDVVYFNPSDMDFPVGFNILEAVDERHKHLVASGMMGVFKKIWENMWSSRMEYILNNTILALLDNPGSTLLGINRMLSDAEYRKKIVSNVKDPIVRQFWLQEFASYNEKYATEAVAPIQNKIGQFLSASIIRNIVAQVKSTIDVRQVMDSQKILIINLSKGRIGEDNSRLLGGMLITKIQLSAMERVDMPETERKDFYLYVDEFQNFAVESFANILSEARKYRLCLNMAHQYIAQLSDEVREAVFGNVGTIITYRVGSPDAEFLEKEFAPTFTMEDIVNLPKFNVYLRLLIDGVASQPFSAMTLPPIAQVTQSFDKVTQVSRERYAHPRHEIEDKIVKWSGLEGVSDDDLLQKAADKKKSAKDSRKPKHEYNCTRCEKDIVLPVELDRSRPIYCSDCIEVVREERKSGKKSKSDKVKRVAKAEVPMPPKIEDGEVVERLPEEPSISLSSLKKESEEIPKQEDAPEEIGIPENQEQDDEGAGFSIDAGEEADSGMTITLGSLGEPPVRPPKPTVEKENSSREPQKDSRPSQEEQGQDDAPKKRKRKRKRKRKGGGGSSEETARPSREESPKPEEDKPKASPPRLDPIKLAETNFAKKPERHQGKAGKLKAGQSIKFD